MCHGLMEEFWHETDELHRDVLSRRDSLGDTWTLDTKQIWMTVLLYQTKDRGLWRDKEAIAYIAYRRYSEGIGRNGMRVLLYRYRCVR